MPQASKCPCGCLDDPLFIIKLQKRCLKFARTKGVRREDAEDFSSWAVIHYLETKRHHIPWMFVDYLRKTFGDSRSKNFKIIYALNHPEEYIE